MYHKSEKFERLHHSACKIINKASPQLSIFCYCHVLRWKVSFQNGNQLVLVPLIHITKLWFDKITFYIISLKISYCNSDELSFMQNHLKFTGYFYVYQELINMYTTQHVYMICQPISYRNIITSSQSLILINNIVINIDSIILLCQQRFELLLK